MRLKGSLRKDYATFVAFLRTFARCFHFVASRAGRGEGGARRVKRESDQKGKVEEAEGPTLREREGPAPREREGPGG